MYQTPPRPRAKRRHQGTLPRIQTQLQRESPETFRGKQTVAQALDCPFLRSKPKQNYTVGVADLRFCRVPVHLNRQPSRRILLVRDRRLPGADADIAKDSKLKTASVIL